MESLSFVVLGTGIVRQMTRFQFNVHMIYNYTNMNIVENTRILCGKQVSRYCQSNKRFHRYVTRKTVRPNLRRTKNRKSKGRGGEVKGLITCEGDRRMTGDYRRMTGDRQKATGNRRQETDGPQTSPTPTFTCRAQHRLT